MYLRKIIPIKFSKDIKLKFLILYIIFILIFYNILKPSQLKQFIMKMSQHLFSSFNIMKDILYYNRYALILVICWSSMRKSKAKIGVFIPY